jgi:uncharacterized protein (TIGR03083 family)
VIQPAQQSDERYDTGPAATHSAADIPKLSHHEALNLTVVETERFLELVEALDPDDWERPTACARWSVRQIVAHVAGSDAGYVKFSELKRQNSGRAQRPYRTAGFSKLDALNQIQVDDRKDASPADLITELREMAPKALKNRQRIPAVIRRLPLPMGLMFPFKQTWVQIGYLTDLILLRDLWMHRFDIARATGRPMELTPEHDCRITSLVVRDLTESLPSSLQEAGIVYRLTGPAGGSWQIGPGVYPATTLTMDALDFHRVASGRLTAEDAVSQSLISLEGEVELARRVLADTSVTY